VETRADRVYAIKTNFDEEIAIEIKKMENDLELYADGSLTPDDFMKRIKQSEAWIMHFVWLQQNLMTKLDLEENNG